MDLNNVELGNVGLLAKVAVVRSANFIVTAGMFLSTPTADDTRLQFRRRSLLELRNNAWLLQPVLATAWAPPTAFTYRTDEVRLRRERQSGIRAQPGGAFKQRGVLTDQTYLCASGAVCYWFYRAPGENVSRVSLQGELHYNPTLRDRNVVQSGFVLVADLRCDIDVLNATTSVNAVLGDQATLSMGVSIPVNSYRLYDWNLMARLNFRFGPVSR